MNHSGRRRKNQHHEPSHQHHLDKCIQPKLDLQANK